MLESKQGANNVMVRLVNRKNIKKLLYKEEALTKQDIVNKLSLSLPTVNLLVQQLKDDNLIIEQPSDMSSGGRKPQLFCFNYDAKIAVGVEISQNHNRIVLINLKSEIIDQDRIRVQFKNDDEYWNEVSQNVKKIIFKNGLMNDQILGIGIAIPGVIKKEEQIIELAPTLDIKNLNYNDLKNIFELPIIIENEANAAGFAEVWNSDIVKNAIYLSITKGVGGAVIINNRLFCGENNRSGEFGHMTLIPDGIPCLCGRKGCFEAYCSTKVLTQYSNGDIDDFFKLKDAGNKGLDKVWNEYLNHLAIGISNLKISFDTEIILGGDLCQYLNSDYNSLRDKVNERLIYEDSNLVFRISDVGENASALGSALLLVTNFIDKN